MFPIYAVFFVSSAYFDNTYTIRSLHKSYIMIMKRIGPSTVPWGIPDNTLNESDSRPFTDIHWNLPTRNYPNTQSS